MLGLPASAGTSEVIEEIRRLQRQINTERRQTAAMKEAWEETQARLQRAEDPNNWRATWTGDESTTDVDTTVLDHGNLITLEGTGQALFHFRPCCQNLRCECRRRNEHGYCVCHKNDE